MRRTIDAADRSGRIYSAVVTQASPNYQLMVFSGEELRTIDLPRQGTVTIGRGSESTVRIDDPSVSRVHAVLHMGEKLVIEDLGGPNGTLVRERADAGSSAETLNVRQLRGRKIELGVGESILFGTASVVVRHAQVIELPELSAGGPAIVVRNPAMRALYAQAALAGRTQINVLILGETGVGKEVLARAIHACSPRSKGPFVAVNCASLSESLQESELFGHEKGSFSGALRARAGLFESAAGGTVFLDEVADLQPSTQAKLLRVLQERVVTPVGSNRERSIDVRVVAATNKDVEAEIGAGRFRPDLFFRLNGVLLLIPPLRDRREEVEPLARLFLAAACRQIERSLPLALSREALKVLRDYAWPGNVRELHNAIERAVVLCLGEAIMPEHLPPALVKSGTLHPPPPTASPAGDGLKDEIKSIEKARIIEALASFAGSQTQAARMLGISRGTLIARLDEFGLARPRKRDTE